MDSENPAIAADGDATSYRRLIELGIALSAELNHDRLMETILVAAKEMTNADGGDCRVFAISSLYLL